MAKRVFIFVIILSAGISQINQIELKQPRGYPNYTILKWAAKLGFIKLVNLEPEIPTIICDEFMKLLLTLYIFGLIPL